MSVSQIDLQIQEKTAIIDKCKGNLAEVKQIFYTYQKNYDNYQIEWAAWNLKKKLYDEWVLLENNFIAKGRKLKQGNIWDNNKAYDCNDFSVETGAIAWNGGWWKDCHYVSSNIKKKCTACGSPKCYCGPTTDSGNTCKKSCVTFSELDPSLFKQTIQYQIWILSNPKPPFPGNEPQSPSMDLSVNIACSYCSQTVTVSDLTISAGGSANIDTLASQTMNCIANLETEKSKLQAQKAAELDRLAQVASDAEKARLAVEAEKARLAALESSKEATKAATGQISDAELVQSLEKIKSEPLFTNKIKIMLIAFIGLILLLISIAMILSLSTPTRKRISPNIRRIPIQYRV